MKTFVYRLSSKLHKVLIMYILSRLNDKVYLISIASPVRNNYTVEYLPLSMRLREFSTDNNYYVSGQSLKMSATRGCGHSLTVRVASTLLSAKHCKIQEDKIVRPQCHKIPWVLQWDSAWRHVIGIRRGFIIPQRKDHRASGVEGKRGMDSIQRRNAHARN